MADERVLFITGASSGIGAATARAALGAGWSVALSARSAAKLDELAAQLDGGERVLVVPADVTEWDQLEAAVERTRERFGRLDAVFANAGFGARRGFLEESPEQWRSMVLTNVYGAALTIRATLPAITASRGHVLLTGSVAGRRALPGSLYSSTKFAVGAMAESLRQELNGTGARVTLIAPGMVDTPFFDSAPSIEALHPEDVAGAVLWALGQPPRVDVNEILLRPTAQDG
ncbi:Short-chain dehydrogenase/reductase SDR [Patulibacter medicamentivorans]|uniref:Short-chain dehydrogenase/reductase SDR n=1 Tax=Patulibacter medicamentivorans TaxID=1097667 RepID=H0E8L0_9ACTN|nr:SDR family oxidoreductase [Patulibacter medicamentivorans]EHN10010.1 Short-chain dehydrogenase/reductase SDR [Patulibacter medicamentivorans]